MAFTFLTQIPNTPENNSPTLWLDENGDLIVQGYKATEEDYLGAERAGSTPGHHHNAASIPDNEAIVRVPASLIPALKASLA
ncbi:MAG: hypothetical protein ACRDRS_23620 [Pseudonocardiaceae bacterium]